MADNTLNISKMKVVELRKELKTRGLSYTGDKSDLVARLQAAIAQDDHADINLDSDEIDSDGVLEDEEYKSQTDILDDTADPLNEELELTDLPTAETTATLPTRTLKRKITTETTKEKSNESKLVDGKEMSSRKIILNRAVSISKSPDVVEGESNKTEQDDIKPPSEKVKIMADLDSKSKLEMRAKRFGLPVKVSDADRKEARKQRFSQNGTATNITNNNLTLSENLDKLKKRAERFGQSVSKIMTDIENKERLEKRKAKFGTTK